MGREIKRVPLDFSWPLNKVWEGFLNPLQGWSRCAACDGDGSSPEARRLKDQWYGYAPFHPEETGSAYLTVETPVVREFAARNVANAPEYYGRGAEAIVREATRLINMWNFQWLHHLGAEDVAALLEADRLWDFTRVARTEEQRAIVKEKLDGGGNSWLPESNGYVPTPAEVNEWSLQGFGHDSMNCWICVEAKCKRLGVPAVCATCDGSGTIWESPEAKAAHEAWEPSDPPTGEGYQVWETVSEGSPISPVFDSKQNLVAWLVGKGYSREAAEAFSESAWVPSMVMADGKLLNDIESAVLTNRSENA